MKLGTMDRLVKRGMSWEKVFSIAQAQSLWYTVIVSFAVFGLFNLAMSLIYHHALNGGF